MKRTRQTYGRRPSTWIRRSPRAVMVTLRILAEALRGEGPRFLPVLIGYRRRLTEKPFEPRSKLLELWMDAHEGEQALGVLACVGFVRLADGASEGIPCPALGLPPKSRGAPAPAARVDSREQIRPSSRSTTKESAHTAGEGARAGRPGKTRRFRAFDVRCECET